MNNRPTLVFPSGTCRAPTVHPPAPKVPAWNLSRSKIASCGGKVAAPGTCRECRPILAPWNPSRILNKDLAPRQGCHLETCRAFSLLLHDQLASCLSTTAMPSDFGIRKSNNPK